MVQASMLFMKLSSIVVAFANGVDKSCYEIIVVQVSDTTMLRKEKQLVTTNK
jgi:hypothetical protein